MTTESIIQEAKANLEHFEKTLSSLPSPQPANVFHVYEDGVGMEALLYILGGMCFGFAFFLSVSSFVLGLS